MHRGLVEGDNIKSLIDDSFGFGLSLMFAGFHVARDRVTLNDCPTLTGYFFLHFIHLLGSGKLIG